MQNFWGWVLEACVPTNDMRRLPPFFHVVVVPDCLLGGLSRGFFTSAHSSLRVVCINFFRRVEHFLGLIITAK